MRYVETFIAFIDLIGWTKLFLESQQDAIDKLAQFQKFARMQLEGNNYLSYAVTLATPGGTTTVFPLTEIKRSTKIHHAEDSAGCGTSISASCHTEGNE